MRPSFQILKSKFAATGTETGLIIGLIAVLLIGSLTSTGEKVRDLFVNTENTLRGSAEGTTYIGPIPAQSILSNGSLTNVNLKVNDTNEPLGTLDVSASSSNTDLLPNSAISIQFSKGKWFLSATPRTNVSGVTTITATATGDTNTATTSFQFAVTNQPPTITPSQTSLSLKQGQQGTLTLDITDTDSAAGDLNVTVTSSNPAVIPASNLTLSGGGNAYNLSLTPVDGGSSTITISASDGIATAETTINVTATAVYTSCLDLKTRQPSTSSGSYTIDPDGYNGAIAEQSAYCDMTGGFTLVRRTQSSAYNTANAEADCQNIGMRLFVPRTATHIMSAISTFGGNSIRIMGIYAKSNGATCVSVGLNSNTCGNWGPKSGGRWYVSNRTDVTEPNGDNVTTTSMTYQTTGTTISWYNDTPAGGNSSQYLCSATDES